MTKQLDPTHTMCTIPCHKSLLQRQNQRSVAFHNNFNNSHPHDNILIVLIFTSTNYCATLGFFNQIFKIPFAVEFFATQSMLLDQLFYDANS